jgi:hypothetical protein
LTLNDVRGGITPENRQILGKASRTKKAGWFKSVTCMEAVACDIVGPDLANVDAEFKKRIDDIFTWISHGGE